MQSSIPWAAMGNAESDEYNRDVAAEVDDLNRLLSRKDAGISFDLRDGRVYASLDNAAFQPPKQEARLELAAFRRLYDELKAAVSARTTPQASSGSDLEAVQAKLDSFRKSDGAATTAAAAAAAERECCVCLDRKSQLVLACLHSFCEPCIKDWCARSAHEPAACPLCRAEIQSVGVESWLLVDETPVAQYVWQAVLTSARH